MANSLLDTIDGLEPRQVGASTLGYYLKVKIAVGWKAFVGGTDIDQSQTLAEFTPSKDDPTSKDAANAKVRAYLDAHGHSDLRTSVVLAVTMYKATNKGAALTWNNDQVKTYPTYADAYQKVWKLAIEKLGITKMGEYWGHIVLADDPKRKVKAMNSEEMVADKVWVLDAIYPTEVACKAAADAALAEAGIAAAAAPGGGGGTPAGLTVELWAKFKKQIQGDLEAGKNPEIVAANWGVTDTGFLVAWKANGYK